MGSIADGADRYRHRHNGQRHNGSGRPKSRAASVSDLTIPEIRLMAKAACADTHEEREAAVAQLKVVRQNATGQRS